MKRVAIVMAALCLAQWPARAQECNPQRIIVGFAAGGGGDSVARLVAQRLQAKHGRNVIVENRTGAGGNIAAEFVAKAPKDGCTLLLTANSHNLNPLIFKRAGYESKDFAPVTRGVIGPALLVAATNQPFKTLTELVTYAKANPGKLTYATSGIGGPNHIAMELFVKAAKLEMTHVPYRGAAPAMADTVAGVVPLSVGSVASSAPFVTAGRVVPLAVSGARRWPTLPNVPTMAEAGYPDAVLQYWTGILAPAGTPTAVLDKLNREIEAVLHEPESREALQKMGYEPEPGTVQDFARFLAEDEAASRRYVQDLKLVAE
jgi:tripartite-type tricarboxylate transporter receptor subunit TctC